MERLFKYIRETNDKRTELELEYKTMKSLLETKMQNDIYKSDRKGENDDEESAENLKVNLRELEKRRTQQALNYEEALLELEALKKNNQRQNSDLYRKCDSKDDLEWLLELMSNYSNKKNVNNSAAPNIMEKPLSKVETEKYENRSNSLPGLRNNLSAVVGDHVKYMLDRKDNIPAPVQIRIENQPNQSGCCKVIRWKSPDLSRKSEDYSISSYHIYVDGDFYKAVPVAESPQVMLPELDNKSHRVSIRSVCARGQSKDPQCTIEINPTNYAPTILKANKITGTSATVSWLPSNSTFYHIVWLNGVKFCECPQGVYKILLYGLFADSLQKVRVHPVLDLYPDTTTMSAYLDFQTLPVCGERKSDSPKKSMESAVENIDPPKDVKIKSSRSPGRFTVYWLCAPHPATSVVRLVGYSILINNQCIALVNGAQNHKFSVNLSDLRGISIPINQMILNLNQPPPYLSLTMRTLATVTDTDKLTDCTMQSKDSAPPFRFTGAVAAEIAGTEADAVDMIGDEVAQFLKLKTTLFNDTATGKSSWHSCYCLNNTDILDDDSSFLPRSDFDWIENKSTPYRSLSTNILEQPHIDQSSLDQSLATDHTGQDEAHIGRVIRPQLSNDSCSSDSSCSYSHTSPCKSTSPRGRSINDPVNDDYDDPSNYLTVRHESMQSRSPRNSIKGHSQEKISVPKIQITKDSSYSEDDDEDGDDEILSARHRSVEPRRSVDNYRSRASPSHNSEFRSSQSMMEAPPLPPPPMVPPLPQSSNHRVKQGHQYSNAPVNSSPEKYSMSQGRSPGNVVRYFLTLYDYDPATMSPNANATNEELPFKASQTIKVFGPVDADGFYMGEIDGQRGLVPSNMVQEIDTAKQIDRNNNTGRGLRPTKDHNVIRCTQAMPHSDRYSPDRARTFVSQSRRRGEDYQRVQRKSVDSALGHPAVMVDAIATRRSNRDIMVDRPSFDVGDYVASTAKKMIALYDYDPQILSPNVDSDAELPFKANDVITILSDIDEDGFYLGERNGHRGLVPSNFLSDVGHVSSNRLAIQQSFDSLQNRSQFCERKMSASSNLSDPAQSKDNRTKVRDLNYGPKTVKSARIEVDEYSRKRSLGVEQQKDNSSFEESFDSGPSTNSSCVQNPEPASSPPYISKPEHRGSMPTQPKVDPSVVYHRPVSSDNQVPLRAPPRPTIVNDRRDSHPKSSRPTQKPPMMDVPTPVPLEPDDMPIVMDLAPAKDNQKKKKLSTAVPEHYRSNLSDHTDNYSNSGSACISPNSSMSDNLERKRSVFKNPFKKKK